MMQRIYREVMIMGLSSFVLGIMETANVSLGDEWDLAYYFADQCAFVTSVFFAFHGLGLMAISVHDARAWERAGKIESHQLLADVEQFKERRPYIWKLRYFPFCSTRSQAEFRVFRSLFSSTYSIGGNARTFDFALFLRKYHENNLLTLINLDAWKWLLVVVMIGVAAVYEQYYSSHCDTGSCKDKRSLVAFTAGGCSLVVCAILLLCVGRHSEFKLLRKVGILDNSDLEVFLLLEHRVREMLSDRELGRNIIITTIAELKHENAVKSFTKQDGLLNFHYTGSSGVDGGGRYSAESVPSRSEDPDGQARQVSLFGALRQQFSTRSICTSAQKAQFTSVSPRLSDIQKPMGAGADGATGPNESHSHDSDDDSRPSPVITPDDRSQVSERALRLESLRSTSSGGDRAKMSTYQRISPEVCPQDSSRLRGRRQVQDTDGDSDSDVVDISSPHLPVGGTLSTSSSGHGYAFDLRHFSSDDLPSSSGPVDTVDPPPATEVESKPALTKRPFSFRALVSRGSDTSIKSSELDVKPIEAHASQRFIGRGMWSRGLSAKGSFKMRKDVSTDAIASVEGGGDMSPRGKLPMPPAQAQARKVAKSVFDELPDGPRVRSASLGKSISRGLSFMSDIISPSNLRQSSLQSNLKALPAIDSTTENVCGGRGIDGPDGKGPQPLSREEKVAKRNLKEKLRGGYNDGTKHAIYFKDIFVWRRPGLYYGAIDVVMTANSLYLSWWITTFIFVAQEQDTVGLSLLWIFVSLLPALITFPLLGVVIRTSTVLKSFTELDLDAVASVVEETMEIRKFVNLLRGNLRKRIDRLPPESRDEAVSELFSAVDDTENGELSREDFRKMLVRLQVSVDIFLPLHKVSIILSIIEWQMFLDKGIWNAIFSAIDLNNDNIITLKVPPVIVIKILRKQNPIKHDVE